MKLSSVYEYDAQHNWGLIDELAFEGDTDSVSIAGEEGGAVDLVVYVPINDFGKPMAADLYNELRRRLVERKYGNLSTSLTWGKLFNVDAFVSMRPAGLHSGLIARAILDQNQAIGIGAPVRLPIAAYWPPSERVLAHFGSVITAAHLVESEEVSLAPDWVTSLYDGPQDKAPRSSIRTMLLEIASLLIAKDFKALNALLLDADFTRLPPEIVMGLLRATAVANTRLPSWKSVAQKAATELRSRNLPADLIMEGLLEKADESGASG